MFGRRKKKAPRLFGATVRVSPDDPKKNDYVYRVSNTDQIQDFLKVNGSSPAPPDPPQGATEVALVYADNDDTPVAIKAPASLGVTVDDSTPISVKSVTGSGVSILNEPIEITPETGSQFNVSQLAGKTLDTDITSIAASLLDAGALKVHVDNVSEFPKGSGGGVNSVPVTLENYSFTPDDTLARQSGAFTEVQYVLPRGRASDAYKSFDLYGGGGASFVCTTNGQSATRLVIRELDCAAAVRATRNTSVLSPPFVLADLVVYVGWVYSGAVPRQQSGNSAAAMTGGYPIAWGRHIQLRNVTIDFPSWATRSMYPVLLVGSTSNISGSSFLSSFHVDAEMSYFDPATA